MFDMLNLMCHGQLAEHLILQYTVKRVVKKIEKTSVECIV